MKNTVSMVSMAAMISITFISIPLSLQCGRTSFSPTHVLMSGVHCPSYRPFDPFDPSPFLSTLNFKLIQTP